MAGDGMDRLHPWMRDEWLAGHDIHIRTIASEIEKSELGLYLRNRIGVPSEEFISTQAIKDYGRTDVEVKLVGEGVYSFDFSV